MESNELGPVPDLNIGNDEELLRLSQQHHAQRMEQPHSCDQDTRESSQRADRETPLTRSRNHPYPPHYTGK